MKLIRQVAERVLRDTCVRRAMPRQFGSRPINLSPDACLSCIKPFWAKSFFGLFDVVTRLVRPGDEIWDVGANVGMFALAAAHKTGSGGHVLAIEADPFLATLLQRTAMFPANADLKLDVFCGAVSDQKAISKFLVAKRGRASSSLAQVGHRSQAGGTRYASYVPTVMLDDFLDHFSPPDLLKIDVEGAELLVLGGAKKILKEKRPVIFIEVGDEQSAPATALLRESDYALFDGDEPGKPEVETCVFNTIAIPKGSERLIAS